MLPNTLLHLNLSGNALTSLAGLELPNLVWLDASNNQLQVCQLAPSLRCPVCTMLTAERASTLLGCRLWTALRHAQHCVRPALLTMCWDSVEGLSLCKKLTVLDLSRNRLSTELQHRPLALLSHLQHLMLVGNPGQLPRALMRSMMPGTGPCLL